MTPGNPYSTTACFCENGYTGPTCGVAPSPSCSADSDCGGYGTCEAGICECNSFAFTGPTCTTERGGMSSVVYVSEDGDDSASGFTPEFAKRTPAAAMLAAQPGMTMKVATGTYPIESAGIALKDGVHIIGGFTATFNSRPSPCDARTTVFQAGDSTSRAMWGTDIGNNERVSTVIDCVTVKGGHLATGTVPSSSYVIWLQKVGPHIHIHNSILIAGRGADGAVPAPPTRACNGIAGTTGMGGCSENAMEFAPRTDGLVCSRQGQHGGGFAGQAGLPCTVATGATDPLPGYAGGAGGAGAMDSCEGDTGSVAGEDGSFGGGGDPSITAYQRGHTDCGPRVSPRYNWDWCQQAEHQCAATVQTDLCDSGAAYKMSDRTSINIDDCQYIYYAQYSCAPRAPGGAGSNTGRAVDGAHGTPGRHGQSGAAGWPATQRSDDAYADCEIGRAITECKILGRTVTPTLGFVAWAGYDGYATTCHLHLSPP